MRKRKKALPRSSPRQGLVHGAKREFIFPNQTPSTSIIINHSASKVNDLWQVGNRLFLVKASSINSLLTLAYRLTFRENFEPTGGAL